jgi:hypothetical protein
MRSKGILETLPNARSDLVHKQHLLKDGYGISKYDYDPRVMDESERHRAHMRKLLYAKKVPKGHPVSINSKDNYADEDLPEWMSTMKTDFIRKQAELRFSDASEGSYNQYSQEMFHDPSFFFKVGRAEFISNWNKI